MVLNPLRRSFQDPAPLRLRVAAVALSSILAACASGTPGGYGPGHARIALASDPAGLVPGAETLLGVSFELEPGWHTYWNGQNDTGYPIRIAVELPAGFTAGELQWPAPRRHVSPGGILDHVYDGRVTLLLLVQAPENAKPGTTATLRVRAEWLACKSECVPGRGEAKISLPVVGGGAELPTPDAEKAAWIVRARKDIPKPASLAEAGVEASWSEDTLVVRVPGDRAAAFYPDTASVPIEDLLRQGESRAGELRLRPRPNFRGEAISGVLALWEASAPESVYFHVREPLPVPNRKETD